MKKKTGQSLMALTSFFSVELLGIEPASLTGLLPSELPVRYVSLWSSTARYLRFRSRVLTASRPDSTGRGETKSRTSTAIS
jgi:hypothetical protein